MLEIPEDWAPTADNINALPFPIRRYIMLLETSADPAGAVRQNWELRQQITAVEAMVARVRAELGVDSLA